MKNDLTVEQLKQPVAVTLPLGVVLNITENEDCILVERAPALKTADLLAIGAAHFGGIYAGLSLEDEQPVALILLPEDLEPSDWKDATAWVKKQGGMLPSRIDHLVLFKNLKKEFQESWYWSSDQHASDASYAWMQNFDTGSQTFTHQSNACRARAVRRVELTTN